MEQIKTIFIEETGSTIDFLRDYRGEEGTRMTVACAESQTAGRGQGSNRWESEAGKNLLLAVKTYPKEVPARRQFVLLEAGALAVKDALERHTDGISVKWPNDVYHGDCKISGTLSECTIAHGLVTSCIIGTGININQRLFTGDAPNPTSLAIINGRDADRTDILGAFAARLSEYLDMIDGGLYDDIHAMYKASLYRRHGIHEYRDAGGGFTAAMETVHPDGRLVLSAQDGKRREYAFKEVSFIINGNQSNNK